MWLLPKGRGRGRPKKHKNLLPDGSTREQADILRNLAEDRGISVADLRREIYRDYLSQFDWDEKDQGLSNDTED